MAITSRPFDRSLLLLQAAVFLLLLIGGVNVTNLLLVRAGVRVKELAVRQALGASRGYVISEIMMETTLLTLMGGLAGIAIGAAAAKLLVWLGVGFLPIGSHIRFNVSLALLGLAAALLMGFVLSMPIAWFNLRDHVNSTLQSESRSGTTGTPLNGCVRFSSSPR